MKKIDISLSFVALFCCLLFSVCSFAANVNITTNTNWSAAGIGGGDNVIIKNGATLTVDVAAGTCRTIQIGSTAAPAGNGTLLFNASSQVTVSNNAGVTMGMGAYSGTITMTSGGKLITPDLVYVLGTFTYGTGTLEMTNTATLPSQIGTYYHLIMRRNGRILSLGTNTIVAGNLSVEDGTITTTGSNFNLSVTGNVSIISPKVLTLNGSTFTLTGNLSNNGTFNSNTSTTVFNGTSAISGTSTTGFNNVTINSGKTMSLSGNITVGGTWTNNGGTFTPGTNTVTFNGTGAQTLGGTSATQTFYNLVVNKTAGTTLTVGGSTTTLNISNDFTETTGNFAAPATLAITGNYLLSAGTFTAGSSTTVGGNFTRNGGTFTHSGGTVTFNGTGAQALGGSSATTFYNLTVNKASGTLTQSATTTTVNNKLTMTSGTFSVGTNTLSGTAGVTATGGILQIARLATTLPQLTGASTAYAITGGNVTLNGAGAQTLRSSVTYYDVTLTNSGAKTTTGVTTISNDLNISGSATMASNAALTVGGTFNYNSSGSTTLAASNNISVGNFSQTAGTLTDNGVQITVTSASFSRTGGTFTSTGTVLFNSSSAQSIGGSSSTSFYNLRKSGSGTLSVNLTTTVSNELNISAGVVNSSTNIFSGTGAVTMSGGELRISKTGTTVPEFSGVYSLTGGTVNLNGAGNQTIRAANYYYLDLNVSGTKTFSSGATGIGAAITVGGSATPDALSNSSNVKYNGIGVFSDQEILAIDYFDLSFGTTGTKLFLSGTTKIRGSVTSLGAIGDATTNSTEIEFNGSFPQTVSGTAIPAFHDILINNSAGLTASDSISLHNTITLGSSSDFTNAGIFTLISTASGTARIAEIPITSNFFGNINMQRYLPAIPYYNNGYWHMVGAPVNGSGFQAVNYSEATPGNKSLGYTYTPLPVLAVGEGGFRSFGATPSTLRFASAPPNMGTVTVNTTYTSSSGGILNDGWNLVCNPYPSEILYDGPEITLSNLDAAAYIWDGTQYISFLLGDGENIASGQSFWVKSSANNGFIRFRETAKSTANPTFYKMQNTGIPKLILKMTGNGYSDITDVRFNPLATTNFDSDYDAYKWDGLSAAPHLATFTTDNIKASINSYPGMTQNYAIPVVARCSASGTYTLSVEQINNFELSSCVYLEDLSTGNMYDLKTVSSFTFDIIGNTSDAPRFTLHIGPPITITVNDAICTSGNYFGSAIATGQANGPWTFIWKDAGGNIIQTTTNTTLPDTLQNLTSGNYTVDIINSSGYCTSSTENISINGLTELSANPLVTGATCFATLDGAINLTTTGGDFPYSFLWSNAVTTEDINSLAAGMYSVDVTDASGCTHTEFIELPQPDEVISAFDLSADTVYLSVGAGVQFTNNSSGAVNYLWNFGNGSPIATMSNPYFFYTTTGTYTATLIAKNGVCESVSQKTIVVLLSANGIGTHSDLISLVKIYPRNGELVFDFDLNEPTQVAAFVFNVLGQNIGTINDITAYRELLKLDMSHCSDGFYLVQLVIKNQVYSRKISFRK